MNPLVQLLDHKQSFWLDFIRRSLMTSGELKTMVAEQGLRGMTSNPTIFQKAIEAGDEYDATIKKLAQSKKSAKDIFDAIAIQDIQQAADALKPVYKESQGADGYVSLEVNPKLAYDTEGTASEAKRLARLVKRPNLMIKIPGTLEGLPAIEEATFAGISVNVTLLFSVDIYKKVFDAYLRGLERRVRKKLPIRNIHSVASFFVSRVDTVVDKQLDALIAQGGSQAATASSLLHKIAIANAKLAYAHYENVIKSSRFKKLQKKNGNTQRLLWASTGTKDKRMSDVVYVEELIGPDTVNTMPPATVEAFRDHGVVEPRLLEGWKEAREQVKALPGLGINLKKITDDLQTAGVKSFSQSFDDLLRVVNAKREWLTGSLRSQIQFSLGDLQSDFDKNVERVENEKWVDRIWAKDAALWKSDAPHQKIISNSLGWLRVIDHVEGRLPLLKDIVASVRKGKFSHVLLLGMGGSSLCPEVLRLTFGKKTGYPDLAILDSTEPGSVIQRAARAKPEKTLFIVASKSGSTTEPNAFLSYFYNEVKKKKKAKAGENFIAITDPGTVMESIAKKRKFRHIVLNPSDIGGRYSALSFFGMVPAAIMGMNMELFLQQANRMAGACYKLNPVKGNPGALLGVALGTAAKAGRNKVTFFLSKDINSFGTWAEQLIAESTGKENTGILPVESENIQGPAAYGADRIFVSIKTRKSKDAAVDARLKALEADGHPVIRITLDDKYDLGAEFFRWEIATAVAGVFLDINPFDQPNVQEAKDLTKKFIADYKANGGFPEDAPLFQDDQVAVYGSNGQAQSSSLKEIVGTFLAEAKESDYVALLAYLTREKKNESLLQSIRHAILNAKKLATTVGFGPRYLHSTGQLHKGGDNNGMFISITSEDPADVPIPGEGMTYAALKEAQARGDWQALKNKGRRALHIHLKDPKKGLSHLKDIFESAN